MTPHYYLMKSKKILRLESDTQFHCLELPIREKILNPDDFVVMNQEQANWRVALFRDDIMELSEYREWLSSEEASLDEECL